MRTQRTVSKLPATAALPAVAMEPATAALPAVAMDPATAALPVVAKDPATAALPAVLLEPAMAALPIVHLEPVTATEVLEVISPSQPIAAPGATNSGGKHQNRSQIGRPIHYATMTM